MFCGRGGPRSGLRGDVALEWLVGYGLAGWSGSCGQLVLVLAVPTQWGCGMPRGHFGCLKRAGTPLGGTRSNW